MSRYLYNFCCSSVREKTPRMSHPGSEIQYIYRGRRFKALRLPDFAEFIVTVLGQCVAAHAGELYEILLQGLVHAAEQLLAVCLCAAHGLGNDSLDHMEPVQILRRQLHHLAGLGPAGRILPQNAGKSFRR